ncbi:MAG TPA: ribosome maturation factor RimM [Steroidobacteraceae bacterium]|nr:ribosome maturation factor RimM [Steroidobacteraceae bacterium]
MAEVRPPRYVKLGRVLGPAGVRGWLKVQSYTDPPENLLRHRSWQLVDAQGRREARTVAESSSDGRWLRARFEGIEDRTAAEMLGGADIEVERSALPPTAAREYYRDDLIGFRVANGEGRELGRVSHFIDAPAGPLMVVTGARELWIPAQPAHLKRVSLERGEIEVDWPDEP